MSSEVVPLLNVDDMARSVAFYVDGLGCTIEQAWRPDGQLRWCLLRLDGAGFMVQAHDDSQRPRGVGVTICVFCTDAVALYRRFVERGVAGPEPFVGNRLWVTSVTDPDGYRIDFESPTDLPEETLLSATDR